MSQIPPPTIKTVLLLAAMGAVASAFSQNKNTFYFTLQTSAQRACDTRLCGSTLL